MRVWRTFRRFAALALGGLAAVSAQVSAPEVLPRGSDYKPGPVVEWTAAAGGDGHRYQAVETPSGATWVDAYQWAAARGGFLAAITSAAENDFVYKLVDEPRFWVRNSPYDNRNLGPWLGGCRLDGAPTPKDGWIWIVDRSAIAYFNWSATQPDRGGLGGEDFLHFISENPSVRRPEWNDLGPEYRLRGFVVEYYTSAEIAARAGGAPGQVFLYPPATKKEEAAEKPPPAPAPPHASTPPAPPATSSSSPAPAPAPVSPSPPSAPSPASLRASQ